jgi:MoaA/NifB/PqqE/SkfB family radical SAM enzyme
MGKLKITKEGHKIFRSSEYNYNFDGKTGYFERWGKTEMDDPQFAPFPEILDCEVTTKCNGYIRGGNRCKFCYKNGNPTPNENMSLDTFKRVIDKMAFVTQVAFGADAFCEANPDLFDMMDYCRSLHIVPNITVANITDEVAEKLADKCGAVAVSRYADKDICYDSVKRLTDKGLKQVNIHVMVSSETKMDVLETIADSQHDPRLEKLNAVVLLGLKKKGGGKGYNVLDEGLFKELVDFSFSIKARIGFDSCSCHKFIKAIEERPDKDKIEELCEPCESSCFSSYVNVRGEFFPCSFLEGTQEWKQGLSVVSCNDFVKDIWNHPRTIEFRNKLLANDRRCPVYEV